MKNQPNSSFIFDLIEKYDIFSSTGGRNPMTDDDFNSFCKEYERESHKRDKQLFEYIILNPNNFRCHLPRSKWSLSVAFHVFWYYDEIVLSDPILNFVKNPWNNLEANKHQLQELLEFIIEFKDCLKGGYVFFAGDDLMPNRTSQLQTESDSLLKDEVVLNSFERFTVMGQKPSGINSNESDNRKQLLVQYDGMWGEFSSHATYIPEDLKNSGKLSDGISYDFVTPYTPLSKSELREYGKYELLDALKTEYSKDISVVLESLAIGQYLKTPVLFFRELDSVVANSFQATSPELIHDPSVYDCALPYLEGIPSNRLFEIREQMPEAFRDFRYFLFELVNETMRKTNNPKEVQFIVDSKIAPMQRSLEVEMRNAKRKMKFHGVVAPIVLCAGSLTMARTGVDYSNFVSTLFGTGGLYQFIKTWSDTKSSLKSSELNSVYFLWKANN